jgi:hypothetical protein
MEWSVRGFALTTKPMDFARKRRRYTDGHDGGDDEYRGDRGRRSYGSRRRGRRAHPHVFAWLMLGGGALLLVVALMVIASSVGLWGYASDAYFAVTKLILPESWHDAWTSLPGIAHVAMSLGAVFVTAGVIGEVFD